MTKQKFKLTPYIPLESDIRKAVKDYMRYKGWFIFRVFQGFGSEPGISDLIAIKDGRVLFIELKRPGGKQRDCQKEFQENIVRTGGVYILVDNVDTLIERGV